MAMSPVLGVIEGNGGFSLKCGRGLWMESTSKEKEMAIAEMELEVSVPPDLFHMYQNVSVSIEHIGVNKATEYLLANKKNRKLNERHMRQLRSAMLAGDWWMNGEAIIFSSDGNLLNGQHRLTAVIQSGCEICSMVVRGIQESAFRSLDGGRIRGTGEVLTMDGEKNANSLAAAVQALICFVDSGGNVSGSSSSGRKATASLTARVLDLHPYIRQSVIDMRRNTMFRSQHAAMLHYLFYLVSPSKAYEFASVLSDGHADIGRPFVIFREMLVRTPMRTDLRRTYCGKAIKAFNAEMAGERPKMVKFISGEEFPVINGLDYEKLADSIG
jgi:hypothetical protein